MGLYKEEVNIRIFPISSGAAFLKDQVITLGDLHGNTMKLIFILQNHGILELNKEQFDRLWEIYDLDIDTLTQPDKLEQTRSLLNEFKLLLRAVKKNAPGLLILIGDELADRGNNDIFTLLLMQALHDDNISFQIQLSNHSLQALAFFEDQPPPTTLISGQENSLDNLKKLILAIPELQRELSALKAIYTQHLSLIAYQMNADNKLILYTHAPIDIQTIRLLTQMFNIDDIDLTTREGLIKTMDNINKTASQAIQAKLFCATYIYTDDYFRQTSGLYELLWNRDLTRFPRQPWPVFITHNIHGHVGSTSDSLKPIYANLDNDLGKPSEPVYDEHGALLGVIPADDQGSSLVWIEPQIKPPTIENKTAQDFLNMKKRMHEHENELEEKASKKKSSPGP